MDPARDDDPATSPPAAGGHILYIDDDPDISRFVEGILTRAGWTVELASDGEEGVERAWASHHDLVITGVMMPRLSGFAVIGHLRDDPSTADVPILVVSANPRTRRTLAVGADDYLMKPFDPRALVERVEALLERGRRPANA